MGLKVSRKETKNYFVHAGSTLPSSVNWVTSGAVTAVKDQGQCGSCWSFSTTGAIEGLYAIKKGKLLSFSEQQLVDCSSSYGNQGCNGGWMDYAFKYIEAGNKLELESEYAYTGVQGTCNYNSNSNTAVGSLTEFGVITSNSTTNLQTALTHGPVSVAIDATSDL